MRRASSVFPEPFTRLALIACLVAWPVVASTAGLGRMVVLSVVGQPFSAEIELPPASAERTEIRAARIAAVEAYRALGMERPPVAATMVVTPAVRLDGTPILRLYSTMPVDAPFLDLLVEAESTGGMLQREYALLLDPPAAVRSDVPVVPLKTAPPVVPEDRTAAILTRPLAAPVVATPQEGVAQFPTHLVQPGDTLMDVARRFRPEAVSLERMLVGLHRSNPQAFGGGNLHRLQAGQVLRLPEAQDLQGITQTDAEYHIRLQTNDWDTYRNTLATMAEPVTPDAEALPDAAGEIAAAPATEVAVDEGVEAQDVVRLSAQEGAMSIAVTPAAGEEDAGRRIAALEQQVRELQHLMQAGQATSARTAPALPWEQLPGNPWAWAAAVLGLLAVLVGVWRIRRRMAHSRPDVAVAGTPPLPIPGLAGITLDLDSSHPQPARAAAQPGEPMDIATRLDLATAYLDMGDAEAARALLDEVLARGSPGQRANAQALLDRLGP